MRAQRASNFPDQQGLIEYVPLERVSTRLRTKEAPGSRERMFAQGFSESPHSMVRFGLFNKINHQGKQRTRPNTSMRLTDAEGCPYAARAASDGLASRTCGIQAALGAVVKKDWKWKEDRKLLRGNSRAILMCQAARENKSGRRHRTSAREFSRYVGPTLIRYVPQYMCTQYAKPRGQRIFPHL